MPAIITRTIRTYFLIWGVIALAVPILAVIFYVSHQLSDHWRVKRVIQWLSEPTSYSQVVKIPRMATGEFDFSSLAKGEWQHIYQMQTDDPVVFHRQAHSGSAWDSVRQRLLIFGSDTHGKNWDNSVYFFDLESLVWGRDGPPDARDSYRVDSEGFPVAGSLGNERPWAMHTFDALAYDPVNDALIVASAPTHLKPGRFGDWLAGLWQQVGRHPTWLYDFNRSSWRPAAGKAESFFPYATAYDTNRLRLLGFKPGGIYEFDMSQESWRKVAKGSMPGYHTQAVYDSDQQAFVIFGNHKKSNAVHRYLPGAPKSEEMPTPGLRPPGDQHIPLAYNSREKVTVAVVDSSPGAETWIYSLAADSWRRIESADFPFKPGMNYHMQYSAKHDLLILVANVRGELPGVWVLRL